MIYRTYMKEIPETFKEVVRSGCNKPLGGLWGCRGDEWKEWCLAEEFNLENLENCFEWTLKEDTRYFCIDSIDKYIDLCIKYGDMQIMSIDYMKLKEDYDAIEVTDIVYQLRYGLMNIWEDEELEKYRKRYLRHPKIMIMEMGLYSWDVPSICVMNPDMVIKIKSKTAEMTFNKC